MLHRGGRNLTNSIIEGEAGRILKDHQFKANNPEGSWRATELYGALMTRVTR